ncbi:hypothetical protein [Cognatishimia sp. F0-27]|uniref:hypothetical protein n=1 Tax=Cognatishimia sp. F0-27 TaxID=2816855 RepID=UPI001D0CC596|nr:hypothetical protein [Cognatishimia sp. F0-27]MCC1492302.1 hypothetical protein [Cognatishimia sp. F0-27]
MIRACLVGVAVLAHCAHAETLPRFDETLGYTVIGPSGGFGGYDLLVRNGSADFLCESRVGRAETLEGGLEPIGVALVNCVPVVSAETLDAAMAERKASLAAERRAAGIKVDPAPEDVLAATRKTVIETLRERDCQYTWAADADNAPFVQMREARQAAYLAEGGFNVPQRRVLDDAFSRVYEALERDGIVTYDPDTQVEQLVEGCN